RTVSEGSPATVSDQKEYRTLSIAGAPDPTGGAGGQVAWVSTVALSNYRYSQFDDSLISNEEVLGEVAEPSPEIKEVETKGFIEENILLISVGLILIIAILFLQIKKRFLYK
ncbi:MAG: hypothetical protein Q8L01_00405, partial [Candidatus Woesebacteria bacterium]|nr:hypothetical protein [Candidatus Woesebacteria bacterium]